MASAIEAVTRAFDARASGALISARRGHSVTFADLGALTFTIGGVAGDAALAGFRVYDTFDTNGAPHTQIVAVWNARDGSLQGVILGERLGDLRTGAIGGLAIRHMARADSEVLGMIGSGAQARTQLAAAATVRRLRKVRDYSRDAENRRAFAEEMGQRLDLDITPVASAREAVVGADIVICATSSDDLQQVSEWLGPATMHRARGQRSAPA